ERASASFPSCRANTMAPLDAVWWWCPLKTTASTIGTQSTKRAARPTIHCRLITGMVTSTPLGGRRMGRLQESKQTAVVASNAVVFRQFVDDDLGCASYLIGDSGAGEAAVL